MSAYQKTQSGELPDYETSGGLHDSNPFGPYTQPHPSVTHLVDSYSIDSPQDTDQLSYVTRPELSSRRRIENPQPTMPDHDFRQFPHITSCSPLHGEQGSTIRLRLQSPHELRRSPQTSFFLLFASKRIECAFHPLTDPNTAPRQYALSAQVPTFASTAWSSFTVPLRIMMVGFHSDASADIGEFTYTDQVAARDMSLEQSLSSKNSARRPAKGPDTRESNTEPPIEAAKYNVSPYKPFRSTPMVNASSHLGAEVATPPRLSRRNCPASATSAPPVTAHSPGTPASWSPSFAPLNQVDLGSAAGAMIVPGIAGEVSTTKTPSLIRTSTIQQSSPCIGSATASPPFNPYLMYPSKAVLKLNGDLNSMADEWSLEEGDAKRRLVHFSRQQKGSTIHANFRSIAPEDRQANTICISCIWWEEKKEFFVTSVDTIFLLESLVAVRFTVEEKNRIRRNLEGFRPLTVSKTKADSEEFFRIIMGFPTPKPRNIEKDVKVFPWKILSQALKKIIGKYSASYSSTAGALPTPAASRYASKGASDSGTDPRASTSPRPNELNHGTSPYAVSTASVSPHMTQTTVSVPMSSAMATDLGLQVPTMIPNYSYPVTHTYSQPSQYTQSLGRSPQPTTAPTPSGHFAWSWDGRENLISVNSTQDVTNTNASAYHYNHLMSSLEPSQTYIPTIPYPIPQPGV